MMGFFEELKERATKRITQDGCLPLVTEAYGIQETIEALKEMIGWQADFEGYIDSGDWVKQKAGRIDGHLSNWIGSGVRGICRLIALRQEEG